MITPFLRSSLPLVISRRLSLAVAYSALTCSLSLLASPAVAQTPAGMSLIDSAGKTFHMGDSKNELPNESWPEFEKPVRRVTFTKSFYLGQTKVTYAEWKDVWDWALVHGYTAFGAVGQIGVAGPDGSGRPDTPDNRQHPVANLSWTFAAVWCNARSEKEGLTPCYTLRSDGSVYRSTANVAINCNWEAGGYRLPTNAEWEYAARGGVDDGRRFPWGDTITHSQANYRSNWDAAHTQTYDQSPTSGFHPLYNGTAPVGSFPATGFGLRDMAGNVNEWCWDWFPASGTTFFMRPDPETDPHGDIDGTYRDWRSCCFANSALGLRCAYMDAYVPYQPSWGFGRSVRIRRWKRILHGDGIRFSGPNLPLAAQTRGLRHMVRPERRRWLRKRGDVHPHRNPVVDDADRRPVPLCCHQFGGAGPQRPRYADRQQGNRDSDARWLVPHLRRLGAECHGDDFARRADRHLHLQRRRLRSDQRRQLRGRGHDQ